MNGVHDLGGMDGFGPVERELNEPLFHAAWEARVRAMDTLSLARNYYTIDAFRYGIERMAPADYLRASYFEHWLASIEYNLIEQGFLSGAEIEERVALLRQHPDVELPRAGGTVPPLPRYEESPAPPAATPRFAIDDAVITLNIHPRGHTRLPRYARGKRGAIVLIHGPQTFPDTNAHGLGEQPQMLYNVRFEASELWGDSAEVHEAVHLDLWESYLSPSPT